MKDQPEPMVTEACDALYPLRLQRRGFLGVLGGVVVLCGAAQTVAQQGEQQPGPISDWLHIAEDGEVTVYTGKVELGQNIRTTPSRRWWRRDCGSTRTG